MKFVDSRVTWARGFVLSKNKNLVSSILFIEPFGFHIQQAASPDAACCLMSCSLLFMSFYIPSSSRA